MAGDASDCHGESMMGKVALECGGHTSVSQEDLLARSSFLGGGGAAKDDGDEEELFSTPAFTQDPITMCTLPFTQSQSQSPSPPPAPRTTTAPPLDGGDDDDDDDMAAIKQRRKPRVCTRKVRGARIRTPAPSPKQQQQLHLDDLDPLYKVVLMIPTTTTSQIPVEDFLALARQRGLF